MEIAPRQLDQTQGTAKTFGGLMDIYEQNYIRLRRLIPDFNKIGEKAVSTVPGGVDLYYQCLQRSKYTTVFSLTYKFEALEPNLEIRVYHDARVAEVLACNVLMEGMSWDGKVSSLFRCGLHNLHSRWRLNRFLNKWLHYCLRQGHKFVPHSSSWVRAVPDEKA